MSILVVGVNHRSADLALLERLAVPAEALPKALASLTALDHVLEAVVISTCNRVEIYAHVTRFHPGLQELQAWLAERGDVHPTILGDVCYSLYDDRAASHLFTVAAGLDSMVVGERQIALQVRQFAETAREEGASQRVLQKLFREATRVAKRVRAETALGAGASSMVDIGIDVVSRELDSPLAEATVLIAGAGKMGGLTADRLAESGATLLVWNRNPEKAERLAGRVSAEQIPHGDLSAAIARADVVVCTTGAADHVVTLEQVERAMAERPARPLVMLDLAMPRNVDPACTNIDAVTLVGIGAIRDRVLETETAVAIDEATGIVDEEATRFDGWTRAVKIEPTIRALRQRAEVVRQAEIERLTARLGSLDARQREAVEALTRGVINTLLHEPTIRLKELADHGGAEHYANALRELFDLDE